LEGVSPRKRLKPEEAAIYIGSTYGTILGLARAKKIPHVKYSGRVFFFEDSLKEWLSKKERESEQEKYKYIPLQEGNEIANETFVINNIERMEDKYFTVTVKEAMKKLNITEYRFYELRKTFKIPEKKRTETFINKDGIKTYSTLNYYRLEDIEKIEKLIKKDTEPTNLLEKRLAFDWKAWEKEIKEGNNKAMIAGEANTVTAIKEEKKPETRKEELTQNNVQINKKAYKNDSELPIGMKAEDVAAYLGISRAYAYNLVNSKGFPTLHVGKRMVIPKEKFLKWVNENTGKLFEFVKRAEEDTVLKNAGEIIEMAFGEKAETKPKTEGDDEMDIKKEVKEKLEELLPKEKAVLQFEYEGKKHVITIPDETLESWQKDYTPEMLYKSALEIEKIANSSKEMVKKLKALCMLTNADFDENMNLIPDYLEQSVKRYKTYAYLLFKSKKANKSDNVLQEVIEVLDKHGYKLN